MKTLTRTEKLGKNINEIINNKANSKDLKFLQRCRLWDYKAFKREIKTLYVD